MSKPYKLLSTFLGNYVIVAIALFVANGGSMPVTGGKLFIACTAGAIIGTVVIEILNRPKKA